ncbi:MAG: cytochrome c-type biogenesis protein [Cellvibrio sp.]
MELSTRGSAIRSYVANAASAVKIFLILVSLVFACDKAFAVIETHEFESDVQRQRYQSFVEEMRCPKCQNQNLAGSDSPISADLRNELYEMIKMGKSDREIVDFMVERYGDFILYRPRVSPVTYLLWGSPVALLIIGVIVLIIILRRRRQLSLIQSSQVLNADEQERLKSLLDSEKNNSPVNSKNTNKTNKEPRS